MTQTDTRIGRGAPAVVVALAVAGLWCVSASAQAPAGVFTKAQADTGRAAYKTSCASCHTADLGGSPEFPQLAGTDFIGAWGTRTTKDLYEFIHATMPPEGPQLAPDAALGIVAFILQQNGATVGTTPLTATTAATINKVATGKRPAGPMVAHERSR